MKAVKIMIIIITLCIVAVTLMFLALTSGLEQGASEFQSYFQSQCGPVSAGFTHSC